MQCACVLLSSVACPAVQNFSTLHHKRHYFQTNVNEHKILIFSTILCGACLILKKKKFSDTLIFIFIGLHIKCPLFLAGLNKTRISRQIFEKYLNIKCHVNPSSGKSCSMWMDRMTDMTKPIVAFLNSAKAPKRKSLPEAQ